MERILEPTSDGSHTISIPEMKVTYHSKHGAVQESMHVFIGAGLKYQLERVEGTIHILEMGFGTGLNALLTILENKSHNIRYETLEAYPISDQMAAELNYASILNNVESAEWLQLLHKIPWNQWCSITPSFDLCKRNVKLGEFCTENYYHLIYFDAFAPGAQPELWTAAIFTTLFERLYPGGILVTYCSKGDVRRALQSAGFLVEKIPGPPGKREMVRAHKKV